MSALMPSAPMRFARHVVARRVRPDPEGRFDVDFVNISLFEREYLARGVFSDVYSGTVTAPERRDVAIKKIWADPGVDDKQIAIHRTLDHPHIVRLLYYFAAPARRLERGISWSLLMEMMPTTAAQEHAKFMSTDTIMPTLYIKLWSFQLFSALHYLHSKAVCHRDVKPENLLVDWDSGRLKLGAAKRMEHGDLNSTDQVKLCYRAPELILHYPNYGCSIDIWAAGCILAEFSTNRVLFYGRNNWDQLQQIAAVLGTPNDEQLALCCPGMAVSADKFDEVRGARDWRAVLRRHNPTAEDNCADLLRQVVRYEATLRLDGQAACNHPFYDSIKDPTQRLPNGRLFPVLLVDEMWSAPAQDTASYWSTDDTQRGESCTDVTIPTSSIAIARRARIQKRQRQLSQRRKARAGIRSSDSSVDNDEQPQNQRTSNTEPHAHRHRSMLDMGARLCEGLVQNENSRNQNAVTTDGILSVMQFFMDA